jgi:opacity protein-like surface antigen
MKKIIVLLCLAAALFSAAAACAWDAQGPIYGTEVEFSELTVTKNGVDVKFTNTSISDVKISLRLNFYDRNGNVQGYSLFGLREIAAGTYTDVRGNYLNGNWRKCRDAARMEWQRLTYEILY